MVKSMVDFGVKKMGIVRVESLCPTKVTVAVPALPHRLECENS